MTDIVPSLLQSEQPSLLQSEQPSLNTTGEELQNVTKPRRNTKQKNTKQTSVLPIEQSSVLPIEQTTPLNTTGGEIQNVTKPRRNTKKPSVLPIEQFTPLNITGDKLQNVTKPRKNTKKQNVLPSEQPSVLPIEQPSEQTSEQTSKVQVNNMEPLAIAPKKRNVKSKKVDVQSDNKSDNVNEQTSEQIVKGDSKLKTRNKHVKFTETKNKDIGLHVNAQKTEGKVVKSVNGGNAKECKNKEEFFNALNDKCNETGDKCKNKERFFNSLYVTCNESGEKVVVRDGRYCGPKESIAARKALTQIIKKLSYKQGEEIVFGFVECTRGRTNNNLFLFKGSRRELDNPVVKKVTNIKGVESEIVCKYVNIVEEYDPSNDTTFNEVVDRINKYYNF